MDLANSSINNRSRHHSSDPTSEALAVLHADAVDPARPVMWRYGVRHTLSVIEAALSTPPPTCPECAHPLTEHATPGGECVHAFCTHDQSFESVRSTR